MNKKETNDHIVPEGLYGDALRDWLDTNATTTRKERYTRILTEAEISTAKSECVRLEMEQDDINEEFGKSKKAFKASLDERKAASKILRTQIRSKAIEEFGDIFVFRDKKNSRIIEYTPFGDMIANRRMTPEEMQIGLFDSETVHVSITDYKDSSKSATN